MQENCKKKIQTGADSFLELKELHLSGNSVTGPHRNGMADELAAMANSNSGTIILGVNDKSREITGIPDQALDVVETWVREIVNDLVEPPIICQISKMQLGTATGERNVIAVLVPRSLFVHRSPGGYLHRRRHQATQTQHAPKSSLTHSPYVSRCLRGSRQH